MATAWLARSLSCKSSAVADDVYSLSLLPKKHPPPPVKASVVAPAFQPRRSRSSTEKERPARRKEKKAASNSPGMKKKKKPQQQQAQLAASPARPTSAFLAMTELPEGHSSRRVVELIFASGWGALETPEVEALFRVRGTAPAVARFEDARRAAILSPGADARCAADGNEMMRFQCRAAADAGGVGEVICAAVATTGPSSSAAVRTFASSGAADADASVGGAAPGRRGMLVCRVIAGRVRRADDLSCHPGSEHDSVDAGGGELVVLDGRAVLPCFLVIYKVNNHQASELYGQPPRAPELIR